MRIGDYLVDNNGQILEINNIIKEKEMVIVYNLEVEDYHTYFVSSLNVWVHNNGCSQEVAENLVPKKKPMPIHHYLTNKSKIYKPRFEEIVSKYDLDLDKTWNKEALPHQGRHPYKYHNYMFENIKYFDEIADGDKDMFLNLFETLKEEIRENSDMLYKEYWREK